MKSSLPLLLLLSAVALPACGSKSKDAEPQGDPRDIVVDEKGVTLGKERIADAPGDAVKKIDPLFAKLKEQRENWKMAHPEGKFDGVVHITLGPNVTCQGAFGVYMTAAFAGYPNILLQQGDIVVDTKAAVPKPPDPTLELGGKIPKKAWMTIRSEGEVEVLPERCTGAYDVVPLAEVTATVKEMCEGDASCPAAIHFSCPAGLPMSKLMPTIQSTFKLNPDKMEFGSMGACLPDDGPFGRDPLLGGLFGEPAPAPSAPPPPPPKGKAPKGQLREGAVNATGGLTEDDVKAGVKPLLPDLQACHEKGLLNNPNLQGRVSAKLKVGKKGAVMSFANGGSDMPDSGVTSCVLRALGKAKFAATGKTSEVTYRVMFSPK